MRPYRTDPSDRDGQACDQQDHQPDLGANSRGFHGFRERRRHLTDREQREGPEAYEKFEKHRLERRGNRIHAVARLEPAFGARGQKPDEGRDDAEPERHVAAATAASRVLVASRDVLGAVLNLSPDHVFIGRRPGRQLVANLAVRRRLSGDAPRVAVEPDERNPMRPDLPVRHLDGGDHHHAVVPDDDAVAANLPALQRRYLF
jgi:hypothetical protein